MDNLMAITDICNISKNIGGILTNCKANGTMNKAKMNALSIQINSYLAQQELLATNSIINQAVLQLSQLETLIQAMPQSDLTRDYYIRYLELLYKHNVSTIEQLNSSFKLRNPF